MSKKVKVLLWCVGILVVILIVGALVANYAIDKVLGSLSPGGSATNTVATTQDDTPNKINPDNSGNESSEEEVEESNPDSSTSETKQATDATKSTNSTTNSGEIASNENKVDETAVEEDTSGYSATVSEEKAKAIEEDVTISEKAKVASVLLSSLNASDITTLQQLAGGGLSLDEKKKARDILLEKLTEDQYNELIAIAAKYGVSQGRKYSEVKKDE